MSSIERYLSELRSHLSDLDAKRADEVVAEARSHLEARIGQLRASGMGEDEAMADALRSFGEPRRVAHDLLEGNAAHRRPVALRAVAALVISLGTAFALVKLGISGPLQSPSARFLSRCAGLDLELAAFLLLVLQLLPAAYLAGAVGGRRFWWLAGAPGAFWIGFCWTISLVHGSLHPYATLLDQLRWALILPGLAALVLAGAGQLGARCVASHSRPIGHAAQALAVVCAVYAVSVGLLALGRALDSSEAQSIATVVAVPTVLAFLAAARRDHRLSRRAFLLLFSTVSIGVPLALGAIALLLLSFGATPALFGQVSFWLTVAASEALFGLLVILVYAARTGGCSAKGASPHTCDRATG